jgi:hypothetical protein
VEAGETTFDHIHHDFDLPPQIPVGMPGRPQFRKVGFGKGLRRSARLSPIKLVTPTMIHRNVMGFS